MIYLWETEREKLVGDIEDYCVQIQARLFDSFRGVEKEAKAKSDQFLIDYGLRLGEDGDPAEALENAYDVYIDYQQAVGCVLARTTPTPTPPNNGA